MGGRDRATTYLLVLIVALLHFSLFAHVPYLIRGCLSTAAAVTAILLFCLYKCDVSIITGAVSGASLAYGNEASGSVGESTSVVEVPADSPLSPLPQVAAQINATLIAPGQLWLEGAPIFLFSSTSLLYVELVIALASVALLVWLVARESELAARLAWYSAVENRLITFAVRQEQKVTDALVANIIPPHISDKFNQGSVFSEQHANCGVMFACIKNFSDLYEEGFNSGEGYLRVLNELFADFESLLDKPQFKDVEKIKTIGPCLMCASGLDSARRKTNQNEHAHLYALMDYCFALIKTLKDFNRSMQSFTFKLYIGFNAGDLVSGVIGSTKLHYDIWGDTVNVASRMYSTGKDGHIQVSEDVANMLGDVYNFEKRGTVFVKGKGDMNTYFAVDKKPTAK